MKSVDIDLFEAESLLNHQSAPHAMANCCPSDSRPGMFSFQYSVRKFFKVVLISGSTINFSHLSVICVWWLSMFCLTPRAEPLHSRSHDLIEPLPLV